MQQSCKPSLSLFLPPPLPLSLALCSKGIVQILFRVKQVPQNGKRQFLKELAHGTGGMTLVFMHHVDALRSGSSYQNYAHIAVEECLEVRNV